MSLLQAYSTASTLAANEDKLPIQHQPRGQHLLADLHGIRADKLIDAKQLEQLLQQAARAAGAHILFSHLHSFGPNQGVTGVVLLAESHLSIHTWPECGFAAVDIFMCGQAQPELALQVLIQALQASKHTTRTLQRG